MEEQDTLACSGSCNPCVFLWMEVEQEQYEMRQVRQMAGGWLAKGQVRGCGSKPEVCARGRDGLEGALEFKSWCAKGHVHGV